MLIGSVLLQPGKTDAGALFTSNVSSTAFAPRGTASVLGKFTIGAAIVFMLSALMISMPALSGSQSVLTGSEEIAVEATPTPAAPATDATPTVETVAGPEGNSNAAPANQANSNNKVAIPIQPNPPSNQ